MIEIAGIEYNACGGTHVNSTAQIGTLLIRRTEKSKAGIRIEFVCGERALGSAMRDLTELRAAGELLSVGPWAIAEQLRKVLAENKTAAKQIAALAAEVAHLTAQKMASQDGGVIVRVFPDRDADFLKLLAQTLVRVAARPTIALFATAQPSPTLVFARTAHESLADVHLGMILKSVVSSLGGRGGGSASLAQGGIADPSRIDAALALAVEQIQRANTTG